MFLAPADRLTDAAINRNRNPVFTQPDGMPMGLSWMLDKEDKKWPLTIPTERNGFGFTSLCYLYPDERIAMVLIDCRFFLPKQAQKLLAVQSIQMEL